MIDGFHEECGVFGITGVEDAAALVTLGLHALQHRGQEACGIVTSDHGQFYKHHAVGMVDETLNREKVLSQLKGSIGIGHNRYSTTGESSIKNVQPFLYDNEGDSFALAHNGNLTNALTLRKQLEQQGIEFESTSDTETLLHMLVQERDNDAIHDRFIQVLKDIEGAYALVCVHDDQLVGVRDPMGIRPLVLGRLGDAYVLASESCALDIIGASYEREVEPGELVVIKDGILKSYRLDNAAPQKFCVFEYIYFSRPDSQYGDISVYETRHHIGKQLADEMPCANADIVVPVPDSGVPAALGFAEASNIPFGYGIIRNHYVGRTFIEPTDKIRHLGVKLKHNANKPLIDGKRVVLVDDSIVRGTTSKKIVEMVRRAGAKEVHMRIAAPPTKHSCFYGVDTPDESTLLANRMSVEEIKEYINVDSLAYISMDGLYKAIGHSRKQYCDACFSGEYPVPLTDHINLQKP